MSIVVYVNVSYYTFVQERRWKFSFGFWKLFQKVKVKYHFSLSFNVLHFRTKFIVLKLLFEFIVDFQPVRVPILVLRSTRFKIADFLLS